MRGRGVSGPAYLEAVLVRRLQREAAFAVKVRPHGVEVDHEGEGAVDRDVRITQAVNLFFVGVALRTDMPAAMSSNGTPMMRRS